MLCCYVGVHLLEALRLGHGHVLCCLPSFHLGLALVLGSPRGALVLVGEASRCIFPFRSRHTLCGCYLLMTTDRLQALLASTSMHQLGPVTVTVTSRSHHIISTEHVIISQPEQPVGSGSVPAQPCSSLNVYPSVAPLNDGFGRRSIAAAGGGGGIVGVCMSSRCMPCL